MPVYQLTEQLIFPHPTLASEDGLLAIGGDLSTDRLLLAYANGIFPWFTEDSPIMWWALDPRMVLFPEKLKVSKSLRQTLNSKKFDISFDKHFSGVINSCAEIQRPDQDDTWITGSMIEAYIRLHQAGYAHSVETTYDGKLVGGLYGVSLGKAFFGESMFHQMRDASKVALYYLVQQLKKWDFHVIDVQQETTHMQRLGAETIPLSDFLGLLKKSLKFPTFKGKWCSLI